MDDYITVTEDEIKESLRLFMREHHMLIEGAAAVAIASYLKIQQRFAGKNVVIVICGANIEPRRIEKKFCRGVPLSLSRFVGIPMRLPLDSRKGVNSVKIIALDEIQSALAILNALNLITEIEASFVAYSDEQAVVPPVGELLLEQGEVHIKYGYLRGDEYYVIKIASGFYNNPGLGLPQATV